MGDVVQKVKRVVTKLLTTIIGKKGKKNKPKYVDMGLSVKWATCNGGASSPWEYGDYFAWGEPYVKRCGYTEDMCGTYEKKIDDIGGTWRDSAHKWGSSRRMPTALELAELLNPDNCDWMWISLPFVGVNGCRVTSKKTGNSIFLPAAGWYEGMRLYNVGKAGCYWGSTPSEDDTWRACFLGFDSESSGRAWGCRHYGQPVRPVKE